MTAAELAAGKALQARWDAGWRFYQPGFPPGFVPQPFKVTSALNGSQKANLAKGAAASNVIQRRILGTAEA